MNFIHLHVHSNYSFLDGAATIEQLLDKAQEYGMGVLALTDHNRLTGAVRFYEKARKRGIKPILGAEINLEGGYHLVLLCKNMSGYSNLCRILTEANLSHRDGNPEATREMLRKFNAGLLALSGCARGEIPALVAGGKIEEAAAAADFYKSAFGGDFYIELFRYPSRDGMFLSRMLSGFARNHNLLVVATNNVHYIEANDYRIKELLNAIDLNVHVSQLNGYRTVEQYFKSPKEMSALFKDIPEALAMTKTIADRCNLELNIGQLHFPSFTVPEGETSYSYLTRLAYEGASKKYGCMAPTVIERLETELATIKVLDFCSYFLVVWDIVRWAKSRGIRCQARGSAVDSLVVYALDISIVDPIHYNLLFERFMHPLRREPPDIDLDIDRKRRDEVRDYIYEKYGTENVACVGTISTYMARGAIRDAGKALNIPPGIIEEACEGIHFLSASRLIEKAEELPELKGNPVYKQPDLQEFFKLCVAIDRFPRHMSVHLGGLLIGEGRLSDLVPLEWSSGGDIISQYDKDDIESLGIVKMDLLALPTITVIEDSIRSIKQNHGIDLDIDAVPRDDKETFTMLRNGKTVGVFQLESPAQREMAGRLLPSSFDDIIVSISLVRPGPLKSNMDKTYLARRRGTEPVSYLHHSLNQSLEETLGVILYQEQVLKAAHDLAGMSYAQADGFRRAMTHDRTQAEMEGMRESFISMAIKRGVTNEIAEKVFEQLAAFAAYGFCKAHAVAYAVLSYQTLWLKCHYPAEFFAAVLSNQPMGYYPPRVLVAEAKRSGVSILLPDINCSMDDYTVERGSIRIGLRQVRGMAQEIITDILKSRQDRKFRSFRDFVVRTKSSEPVLRNLARVGAFDSIGDRKQIMKELDAHREMKCKTGESARLLIEEAYPAAADNASSVHERKAQLVAERELLSIDLSAHPLDFFRTGEDFTSIKDLTSKATGTAVKIGGSVIRYQTPPTRNGKRVVYIILEDGTGIADVTVFSDVQEKCGQVLFRCGWLGVEGKIQRRGPKSLSIIAQNVFPLDVQ
jgi:error-prone DNA polymerase